MREHLKNVKNEYLSTQGLNNSKTKEVSTENHLKQLADREDGRIKVDIEKLKREAAELAAKENSTQNSIFKTKEKLESLKKDLELGKEQLEQWLIATQQKEQDAKMLELYTRADEKRIKELTLQLEKLTKEVKVKQNHLDAEVTETRAAQIELDKTSIEFKNLHSERQELIQQWEDTITGNANPELFNHSLS
jgi:hypothetical protein